MARPSCVNWTNRGRCVWDSNRIYLHWAAMTSWTSVTFCDCVSLMLNGGQMNPYCSSWEEMRKQDRQKEDGQEEDGQEEDGQKEDQ